jgi:hypothetical protein
MVDQMSDLERKWNRYDIIGKATFLASETAAPCSEAAIWYNVCAGGYTR